MFVSVLPNHVEYDHHYHEDHVKMNIISKDTLNKEKENSLNNCDMERQDVDPMDSANIPEMTEDELDQDHEIFVFTVDKGHSEMKCDHETTPASDSTTPWTHTCTSDGHTSEHTHTRQHTLHYTLTSHTSVSCLWN
jgi:hypothetical protein